MTVLGSAPDFRFTLANERTFLAWIRTALALDAGGLAVIRLLPPVRIRGAATPSAWSAATVGSRPGPRAPTSRFRRGCLA